MTEERHPDTNELMEQLFKATSLERFLSTYESSCLNIGISDYLTSWCKARQAVPEYIIRKANLDKSFGHQLFSGKRKPSRDTVIRLAFAMDATVDEAQEMLKISGKSRSIRESNGTLSSSTACTTVLVS